jgi:hypothetical protein
LAYLALPWLVQASLREPLGSQRGLVWFVLAIGLFFRLLAFFSEPVLEDDYYRYMWEGGLLANGYNPSAIAPVDALNAQPGSQLSSLAEQSGPVVHRVSHKGLRSNYPPIAQLAFAVSYFIAPWNLLAWKLVSLLGDLAVMALLTLLLRDAGRPVLWSTLYWWNPLIVKELANSGHMDGIVVAFTLAALLMSARGRHGIALVALSLAIGTKLWPVLLTPLLLRPLRTKPGHAMLGLGFIGVTTVLWLLPGYLGGPGETSFYLAYAQRWSTNSALFPFIERAVTWMLEPAGWQAWAWAASRGLLLSVLCGIAVWQSLRPVDGTRDLVTRACIVVGALVLLSPAQFPWYMIWVLPLAAFCPMWSLLTVTATTPLYYLSFFFFAQGAYHVFTNWVVWVIWLPVWGLITLQISRSVSSRTPRPPRGTKAHPI